MTGDPFDAFERPSHAAAARAALAAAGADATPVAAEPLGRGNRKRTVAVRLRASPPLVVQLSDDAAALNSEAALRSAIRDRTPASVPAVVAAGESWPD